MFDHHASLFMKICIIMQIYRGTASRTLLQQDVKPLAPLPTATVAEDASGPTLLQQEQPMAKVCE